MIWLFPSRVFLPRFFTWPIYLVTHCHYTNQLVVKNAAHFR